MTYYEIMFDGVIERKSLQRALGELGVRENQILFGDEAPSPNAGTPAAFLEINPRRNFNRVLQCYGEFVTTLGLSELELTQFLTPRFGLRALIDDGSDYPSQWMLVTPEGGSGTVILDDETEEDDGFIRIDHALAPIEGAPELEVRPGD